jgi:hypothetical protein
MEAQRSALDALSMKAAQPGESKNTESKNTTEGYDTNTDTKLKREMEGMPEIIDSWWS